MYHYLGNPRFQWFFDSPNQCAAILVMFAVLASGLFLHYSTSIQEQSACKKKYNILFSGLSLLICVLFEYMLVSTYSRGGYIALFVGFVSLFFMTGRKRVLFLPIIAYFILLVVPFGANRINGIANVADASIGNRLELWKGALAMSADYWKSGVGFGFGGPFLDIYSAWYQPLWMRPQYNTAVCDYLTMSAKGGIFFLFGYLVVCFCVIFSGFLVFEKRGGLMLAGLLCAQLAYLVSGIFSTFFNVDFVVYPFIALQITTLIICLYFQLKSNDFTFLRKLYIPIACSTILCLFLFLCGMYFRSESSTRYDVADVHGLRIHKVYPTKEESSGIILYLFNSKLKSIEEEARETLRPFAEKGFTVISAETQGGIVGLREAQILAAVAVRMGKRRKLPVMFTGQGEGGRFAVICAMRYSKNPQMILRCVATIGSAVTWPFPGLSPENHIKESSIPFLILHGEDDSVNSFYEVESFLELDRDRLIDVKFVAYPNAQHYLGKMRAKALDEISMYFHDHMARNSEVPNLEYVDYEIASKAYARSADAVVFGGKICPRCDYLKKNLLPQLIARANNAEVKWSGRSFKVISVDLEKPENVLLLMRFEELLGMKGKKTPVLLWNNKLYYGNESVSDLIAENDDAFAGNKKKVRDILAGEVKGDIERVLRDRAVGLSLPLIISAGLIDGINPCVFSTLIFFMSLLGVSKITGGKLLLTGIVYCLACFLTYLLLGFGVLHALKFFSGLSYMRMGVNYVTFILLLICAFISFRDSWVFSRSGDPGRIKLQLPDVVKRKINLVFKRGMSFKYLIPGAFLMGFVVTLLESLCTGQVYVPIMVLLAKESYMSKWFFYLIIYNIMFILPLIAIFLMAYFGVTISSFIKMNRRNVVLSKLLLGCLFCALAVLVVFI